jgi:hypothetical protein
MAKLIYSAFTSRVGENKCRARPRADKPIHCLHESPASFAAFRAAALPSRLATARLDCARRSRST